MSGRSVLGLIVATRILLFTGYLGLLLAWLVDSHYLVLVILFQTCLPSGFIVEFQLLGADLELSPQYLRWRELRNLLHPRLLVILKLGASSTPRVS